MSVIMHRNNEINQSSLENTSRGGEEEEINRSTSPLRPHIEEGYTKKKPTSKKAIDVKKSEIIASGKWKRHQWKYGGSHRKSKIIKIKTLRERRRRRNIERRKSKLAKIEEEIEENGATTWNRPSKSEIFRHRNRKKIEMKKAYFNQPPAKEEEIIIIGEEAKISEKKIEHRNKASYQSNQRKSHKSA